MKEEEKKQEAPKKNPIVLSKETGLPMPETLGDALRVFRMYVESRMLPESYDTPEKVFVGIQYARELGFTEKPLIALRQIAIINGMPSIWGDLPLSLVFRSGVLEDFHEFYVDSEGKEITLENQNLTRPVYASVSKAKRNGRWRESIFSMDDARLAGLYPSKKRSGEPNPDSPWEKYTKRMLRYRSRSALLKDTAPDALNGIAISEYDFNEMPETWGKDERLVREKRKPDNAKEVETTIQAAIEHKPEKHKDIPNEQQREPDSN